MMKVKLVLIVFGVFVFIGCFKLIKENYDKLEMGMIQDEVELILGFVDNCGKIMGIMVCMWGSEDEKYVKVVFMGDKVVIFIYDGFK